MKIKLNALLVLLMLTGQALSSAQLSPQEKDAIKQQLFFRSVKNDFALAIDPLTLTNFRNRLITQIIRLNTAFHATNDPLLKESYARLKEKLEATLEYSYQLTQKGGGA